MPRTTDHESRRAELATAVWQLVAARGMEAVSLRSVAATAGVSMGRVQHYFATKDELLLHGLSEAHRRMEARIEQRLEGADGDREVLVAVLDELLGEHPETRDAIRVHVAFAARALQDEQLAAVLVDGDDVILALAVSAIAQARADGRVGPEVDPELDGHAVFALAQGLGVDVALYRLPVHVARRTLHHVLDRVVPPLTPGR